jgi:TRAP-type C4-dicarboxylate transport system permease large subunit
MFKPTGPFLRLMILAVLALSLPACDAIGAIFKAGVWAGVLLVVVIVVLVVWIVSKIGRRT